MENVLGKITAYDILGYLYPGCVFILMLIFNMDQKEVESFLAQWHDNMTIVYFAFFLICYMSGIMLSEISELVISVFGKFMDRKIKRNRWFEDEYNLEQMACALKRSGRKEKKREIKEKLKNSSGKYYMGYIFGSIQGCSEYKRIHDYASAYILYKNITTALAAGLILTRIYGSNIGRWFYGVSMLLVIIFFVRSCRFFDKKEYYTRIWFIEKFSRNTECND